jgi:hypothetical protein
VRHRTRLGPFQTSSLREAGPDAISHIPKECENGKSILVRKNSPKDYFEVPYDDIMFDVKAKHGPWMTMSETSWRNHGVGRLGIGYGQKDQKQTDGRWLRMRMRGTNMTTMPKKRLFLRETCHTIFQYSTIDKSHEQEIDALKRSI